MSKSYDELQQEADARWRQVAEIRARKHEALAREWANSPDVLNAPTIGTLYSHPAIACSCGCLVFTVRQYGCVNGVRDKATLSCQRCSTTRTWNWGDLSWAN